MIFQLVYVSESTKSFEGSKDLKSILDVARQVNLDLGLTGALLYRSGHFVQLLEGESKNVKALFSKTCKDRRHKNVRTILAQETNERLFSEWSMAFRELHEVDLEKFKKLHSWEKFILASNKGLDVSADLLREVFIELRYKAA